MAYNSSMGNTKTLLRLNTQMEDILNILDKIIMF